MVSGREASACRHLTVFLAILHMDREISTHMVRCNYVLEHCLTQQVFKPLIWLKLVEVNFQCAKLVKKFACKIR